MFAKPPFPPRNFAALHEQRGGVPLDRICTEPAPGTATESDAIAALESKLKTPCELIDGVLVEKASDFYASVFGTYLAMKVGNHIEDRGLGITLGPTCGFRLRPGLVRCPTFSYVPWDNLPGRKVTNKPLATYPPALIGETFRVGNTAAEIDRKLREFFQAGCKLAWVVDPRAKTAKVHTSPTRFKLLDESGTLDGGKLLPGFKLVLAELFTVHQKPKKKRSRNPTP